MVALRGLFNDAEYVRLSTKEAESPMYYENWETREPWQTQLKAQHLQDYMFATVGKH